MANSRRRTSKRGRTFLFSVVTLALAAVFLLGCRSKIQSLKADAARLDQQIEALEDQLSDEKMKALESQVQQRYYESDAYKEILARNKFNLVYDGERLYIIQ